MINVQIIRKKVKNISIKIKNDGSVSLTAPFITDMEYINNILLANQDKIINKITSFKKKPIIIETIVNGCQIYYLGRCYELKVINSDKFECCINGEFFELYVQDLNNQSEILFFLNNWYICQAKVIYNRLIDKYKHYIKKDIKKLVIKKMQTRWGSCNIKTSVINLNLNLILYPIEAIEYVVLHELTHLIHYYHDKYFYSFIEQIMPDWKSRKSLLL